MFWGIVLRRAESSIHWSVVAFETPKVDTNGAPKVWSIAPIPDDVVPDHTNIVIVVPVRSWLIGASRLPDQSPVVVVVVVTSTPFARKTPAIACCPMLSIALTEAVEPIASQDTTDPLYVAPPAWVFTNEL